MYFDKLYHCTTEENFYKIIRDGVIKPLSDNGVVYLSTDSAESVMFTYMRHGVMDMLAGKNAKWLYVFEIDGDDIDWDLADEGCDHSPLWFRAPVVIYRDEIPVSYVNVMKYDISKLKEEK
jgi:hypothetical protein